MLAQKNLLEHLYAHNAHNYYYFLNYLEYGTFMKTIKLSLLLFSAICHLTHAQEASSMALHDFLSENDDIRNQVKSFIISQMISESHSRYVYQMPQTKIATLLRVFQYVKDNPQYISSTIKKIVQQKPSLIKNKAVNLTGFAATLARKDASYDDILKHCQNNQELYQTMITNGKKLIAAVSANDIETAQQLLQTDISVNVQGYFGRNAFTIALQKKNIQMAQAIIHAGFDVNCHDNFINPPIIAATLSRETNLALMVINAGAQINAQNSNGYTALMYAVITNNTDLATILIRKGANPNMQTCIGQTALMQAAYHNNVRLIRLLIDAGADVTLQEDDGTTAYDLANKKIDPEILTLLKPN